MRLAIVLAGLAVTIGLAPTAGAYQPDELTLIPEWPESFQQARSEPIRLLPGPPLEEEASHGPLVPGATTAGSSHSFRFDLENPDGSTGPAGDLGLDASEPIVLAIYLSAGPTAGPLPVEAPIDTGTGVAPSLTVEASLTIAGEELGPQRATETLVSTPLEDNVTRYRFTYDTDRERLPAGAGLSVDLSIYQVNRSGEIFTQPAWRIHTGSQNPSGLTVDLAPLPDDEASDEPLSLQGTEDVSRETIRTGAYAALVAALAAAGWAARRGYRELREG